MAFDDLQYKEYKSTWLYHNEVLIDTGNHVMKFNYPGLGEILMDHFKRFVALLPGVIDLAKNNCSVAGFLFEGIFSHHVRQDAGLQVHIDSLEYDSRKAEVLTISTILRFKGYRFIKNVLYGLNICHPVIDFVGYLEGISGSSYLVLYNCPCKNLPITNQKWLKYK